MSGKVIAVCTSEKKGVPKKNIGQARLKENWGLVGDAHVDTGIRQLSLLAAESIQKMKEKGLNVGPGDFAENITTEGIDLLQLKVGSRLKIGTRILLEISQIGKQCLKPCAVFYRLGDCVFPREGLFVVVLKGGTVKVGDGIEVVE
ncbi:MAG: MOSC domain-containing protein [Candidatus Omnitrophica bacterium]|nr:MOSC domain-containing protein [Candidatus Omnitrophota bacterium]